jgi:hypothetical protein
VEHGRWSMIKSVKEYLKLSFKKKDTQINIFMGLNSLSTIFSERGVLGIRPLFSDILDDFITICSLWDKHVVILSESEESQELCRHSEGVKRPKNFVDSGIISLSSERESRCRGGNDLHLQGEGNPRVSNPLPNFKLSSRRLTSRNSALPQGRVRVRSYFVSQCLTYNSPHPLRAGKILRKTLFFSKIRAGWMCKKSACNSLPLMLAREEAQLLLSCCEIYNGRRVLILKFFAGFHTTCLLNLPKPFFYCNILLWFR